MKYRIADFTVEVPENPYHLFNRHAAEYQCGEDRETELPLQVEEEDIIAEMRYSEKAYAGPNGVLHNSAVQRKLAEQLPFHNAFILHSACFDVDGVGVAFAAHSGTGKTTHMNLWQQLLGDRMTIVNGDKPIVRFFDDPAGSETKNPIGNYPFAYGTPWNGKERLGCNMRTPLRYLCFLERAEQNSCEPMTDTSDAINRIFNQVYMPKDLAAAAKTIELIDRLMHSVQLWKIKCNMNPQAAEVAYHAIFGA